MATGRAQGVDAGFGNALTEQGSFRGRTLRAKRGSWRIGIVTVVRSSINLVKVEFLSANGCASRNETQTQPNRHRWNTCRVRSVAAHFNTTFSAVFCASYVTCARPGTRSNIQPTQRRWFSSYVRIACVGTVLTVPVGDGVVDELRHVRAALDRLASGSQPRCGCSQWRLRRQDDEDDVKSVRKTTVGKRDSVTSWAISAELSHAVSQPTRKVFVDPTTPSVRSQI
jgi:hypothetical protein